MTAVLSGLEGGSEGGLRFREFVGSGNGSALGTALGVPAVDEDSAASLAAERVTLDDMRN